MNMHVAPTSIEIEIVKRRRAFRQSIADRAAALAAEKVRAAPALLEPEAPADPVPRRASTCCPHCGNPIGDASPLTLRAIKEAVCKEFGLELVDMSSPRRQNHIAVPRQIAMWLAYELSPLRSLPAIGRQFGGRDHSTVWHACRAAPRKVAADEKLVKSVARIRAELQAAS